MGRIDCYDSGGRVLNHFTQWDVNQRLIVKDVDISSAPLFYFSNHINRASLVVQSTIEDDAVYADVPNILLQKASSLIVHICYSENDSMRSRYTLRIPILPRKRPNDYVYPGDSVVSNGVNPNIQNAAIGQMIVVKSVDDSGIPVEWESVDRTHWTDVNYIDIFPFTDFQPEIGSNYVWDEAQRGFFFYVETAIRHGEMFLVSLDNIEYSVTARSVVWNDASVVSLVSGGCFELYYADEILPGTGKYNVILIPKNVDYGEDGAVISGSHSLEIHRIEEAIYKLNIKYLDLDDIRAAIGTTTPSMNLVIGSIEPQYRCCSWFDTQIEDS